MYASEAGTLARIPLAHIALSQSEPQRQRRARFDAAAIAELAESIREHGVLQPIIVRPLQPGIDSPRGEPAEYELVAGERRFRAAQEAGLAEIPAVVRALSDEKVLEVQLIENLQREDLHPLDEAAGYQQLLHVHGHQIEDLHLRVGKSKSYVYARLKLLGLTPAAREAFYDGTINASIALLLARIPVSKLQNEALEEITKRQMSFRYASEFVHQRYMLRLKEATFPTDDAELPGGPCAGCPKRTGNQQELFGDVQSPDVCTDPDCFAAKTRAYGQRVIAQARTAGREVITGAAAKKAWPYEHSLSGFALLDERNWADPKNRKNRSIVGKDVVPIIIQNPRTGAAIEVVRQSTVDAALRRERAASGETGSTYRDQQRQREQKAKAERAFRRALYDEIRPRLGVPSLRAIAEALYERLESDLKKLLCSVRGFEAPKEKTAYHTSVNYDAILKTLDELDDAGLTLFVHDCIYVRELWAPTWSDRKPERLLAAAKELGVDVKAVRRSSAPKKAAKKKPNKAPRKTKGSR